MVSKKAKWLTVAPLLAVLTAWTGRIISGKKAGPSTEPPFEATEAEGEEPKSD